MGGHRANLLQQNELFKKKVIFLMSLKRWVGSGFSTTA
jgi:hypothetical protein